MQNQSQKRDLSRINARMRENQRTKARLRSKIEHGAKVMERQSIFGRFLSGIVRFFKGLFRKYKGISIDHPYVYEGPARPKQPNALRFGVYMRRRGRKYKKARAA